LYYYWSHSSRAGRPPAARRICIPKYLWAARHGVGGFECRSFYKFNRECVVLQATKKDIENCAVIPGQIAKWRGPEYPEGGMANLHIFQILNHYTPREALDPGFGVIDNSSNERPDWFEYWPMRKFLMNEALDEAAFYGFLSPKFKTKTNLTATQVAAFIGNCAAATEVVLFSPSIHTGAQFLNVFEHGDAEHPGLLATSKKLLERINYRADLDELVTDSRNTVHSNYFIAKPRFWRQWLAINEQILAIAEAKADELGKALTSYTSYRGRADVQMKIFIMERIATLILASDESFVTAVRNPFVASKRIYKLPLAIICDALKIAYRTAGFSQYMDVFLLMRSLRKSWNFHIRFGAWLGLPAVREHTRKLASYWEKTERQ
jgi:hypothetical protein